MSRLTAAQVISLGEYLEPDFDPSTLTIPQLLGIFGFHNINYPSQYSKSKLVQLFNDEIKARSKKFKREKIKRENSQASDDGITDGLTGRPITEKVVAPRRSSRRASRAPTEAELEQSEPTAPKRRRSSAGPALGGPSRRKSTKPAQPALIEESEPEEESEPPVRKVSRKKHGGDAGTQTRKSPPLVEDNDSGWEDNNVFQSGAESSPMRPSPTKPRARRSTARPTLKARKSMSEPPQKLSETKIPVAKSSRAPSVKPPESDFEPALPSGVSRRTRASVAKGEEDIPRLQMLMDEKVLAVQSNAGEEVPERGLPVTEGSPVPILQEGTVLDTEKTDGDIEAEQVRAVSQRIAEGGHPLAVREIPEDVPHDSTFLRVLLYVLLLLSVAFTINYKKDSAEVGFCERGTSTNAILEERKARWDAILSCNRENRTTLYLPSTPDTTKVASHTAAASTENGEVLHDLQSDVELCPLPPLLPLPHPDSCTPCPRHATCAPQTMTCDRGYIVLPHPLLSFLPVPGISSSSGFSSKGSAPADTFTRPGHIVSPDADVPSLVYSLLSIVLDGLPGLGPVAIPPRCAEDPRRKLHIGVLGKAVGSMLAAERGRRLCEGIGFGDPEGDVITEAQKWGVELDKLKEDVRKKTPPHLQSTLEDTFNEAVQQLVHWGGVFMAEDEDGRRYIAHRTSSMGWDCVAKVKAREAWSEWRSSILATLTLIFSVFFFRRRRTQNLAETERVSSLVQIALDLLRNQELAHHIDPVTAPYPYLSSLQSRDLVLQGEHSLRTRRRLWDRVEKIVESNVNVRTNLEEVEGGDEVRVWRWVGGAGTISSPARRKSPFVVEG